ncbi:MAG TPA: response regulator [Candidatus Pullilachnospira intestinigallinarum]|nr:response regulator [Candidatus Pullilachnospira intestinigallinarum]
MRIIIVEDEPKTREGILNMIRRYTDHQVVAVAENGLEGLEMIEKHRPHLVITDVRMPRMNGLDMLEEVKKRHIDVQAVVLTGYSEFEYARQALRLGVAEYVMKPLSLDDFLAALEQAEARLEQKKAERMLPEQMLWSYICGDQEKRTSLYPILSEELQINGRVKSTMFYIHPGSDLAGVANEMAEKTRELLETMCMEGYYILVLGRGSDYLVLLTDTGRNSHLYTVFETRILKKLQEEWRCRCSCVEIWGLKDIDEKLAELRQLFDRGFSCPDEMLLDEEQVEKLTYEKLEYPERLENRMIRFLREGNGEKVKETGQEFIHTVILGNATEACIKEYTLRFAAGILKLISEFHENAEREWGLLSIITQITNAMSSQEAADQFEKILDIISDQALEGEEAGKVTENSLVLTALAYIRENYAGDIGLADTASVCGISQEHLSKLFYREMGINFSHFLQNFRVSAAKRLLDTGKYKVYEVAEMVGFHDQKYFVTVFKKLCGVTPSVYKKEHER